MNSIDHQLRGNDCGVSAIKTVFNIFGKEIDRNYILDSVFLDEKGSSIVDIKKFFDNNGCKSKFKFLHVNVLQNDLTSLTYLFPFILPIKKPHSLPYIFITETTQHKLKFFTPPT